MEINFNNTEIIDILVDYKRVRQVIAELFLHYGVQVSYINFMFGTDAYVLRINKSFLNHDYYTDVISFELQETGLPLEGEVVISYERIKENGLYDIKTELLRVMLHSCLHFCGFNDKSEEEKSNMRRLEDFWLCKFK